jgi:hypothetical protein
VRFAHHAIFCPYLESDVGRAYKDLHVELGTIVLSANVVPVFLSLAVLDNIPFYGESISLTNVYF